MVKVVIFGHLIGFQAYLHSELSHKNLQLILPNLLSTFLSDQRAHILGMIARFLIFSILVEYKPSQIPPHNIPNILSWLPHQDGIYTIKKVYQFSKFLQQLARNKPESSATGSHSPSHYWKKLLTCPAIPRTLLWAWQQLRIVSQLMRICSKGEFFPINHVQYVMLTKNLSSISYMSVIFPRNIIFVSSFTQVILSYSYWNDILQQHGRSLCFRLHAVGFCGVPEMTEHLPKLVKLPPKLGDYVRNLLSFKMTIY